MLYPRLHKAVTTSGVQLLCLHIKRLFKEMHDMQHLHKSSTIMMVIHNERERQCHCLEATGDLEDCTEWG